MFTATTLDQQIQSLLKIAGMFFVTMLLAGCQPASEESIQSTANVPIAAASSIPTELSGEADGFSGEVGQEGFVSLTWLRDDAADHYEVYRELISSEKVIKDEKIAETTLEVLTDYIELDGSVYRYRVVSISSENEQTLIAKYLTFDTALMSEGSQTTLSGVVSPVDASYALENKYPIDPDENLNAVESPAFISELGAKPQPSGGSDSESNPTLAAANTSPEQSQSEGYESNVPFVPQTQAQTVANTEDNGNNPPPVPSLSQEEELLLSLAELQGSYQASPHGIQPENWSITASEFLAPGLIPTAQPELEPEPAAAVPVPLDETPHNAEAQINPNESAAAPELENETSNVSDSNENDVIDQNVSTSGVEDTLPVEPEPPISEIVSYESFPVPSFPGAEGHGASSIGGRGGKVVKVTNLNDDGPGSLREALMMTVPRIIVFEVSGTIALNSRLELGPEQSYVTIAGQTAPGDGITLRNHTIWLSGIQHVVMRYLRIRHGCPVGCSISVADSITILSDSNNIVLDHLSMTWAEDEVMGVWGSNINNVTVQWSLMAEGNTQCVDGHSQNLGPMLSGGFPQERMTFANNYLAHMCYRNYLQDTGEYQFINNLNYNTFSHDFHFSQSIYSGPSDVKSDVVGHYFKEGPQTNRHFIFDVIQNGDVADNGPWGAISLYFSDIVAVTSTGDTHPYYIANEPYSMVYARGLNTQEEPNWVARSQPMTAAEFPVTRVPAANVPEKVLPSVGASFPIRDAVDERIVNDFYTLGVWSSSNLKQYPQLYTYNVKVDTDNDGMPDEWETDHGLDATDATDNNIDSTGNGYTNIENYINSLVPGVWVPTN